MYLIFVRGHNEAEFQFVSYHDAPTSAQALLMALQAIGEFIDIPWGDDAMAYECVKLYEAKADCVLVCLPTPTRIIPYCPHCGALPMGKQ